MSATASLARRKAPEAVGLPVIAVGVIALHLVVLWALALYLVKPPGLIVVPPMLVNMIAPPAPSAAQSQPPVALPAPPEPAPPLVRRAPPPRHAPSPRLVAARPLAAVPEAVALSAPDDDVPVQAAAAPPQTAPQALPADQGLPTLAAAAPLVVPPSSNAAYLSNPKPVYPAMSRRLGEAGRVVIHALIGADGRVHEARIQRSSGFARLDQVALETARDRWRYVPGTRNGVPEDMWFDVPIDFVLNQASD